MVGFRKVKGYIIPPTPKTRVLKGIMPTLQKRYLPLEKTWVSKKYPEKAGHLYLLANDSFPSHGIRRKPKTEK